MQCVMAEERDFVDRRTQLILPGIDPGAYLERAPAPTGFHPSSLAPTELEYVEAATDLGSGNWARSRPWTQVGCSPYDPSTVMTRWLATDVVLLSRGGTLA